MDNSSLYIASDAQLAVNSSRMPREIWLLLGLVLIVAVGLAYVTYSSRGSLDSTGWALICGLIILVIIIAAGSILIAKKDSSTSLPIETILSEHSRPFLITQNGRSLAANKSYLALFGDSVSNEAQAQESIPLLDNLIDMDRDIYQRSLFRLHNLRDDCAPEDALFTRRGQDGLIQEFKLRVTGLGETKLWEIIDTVECDGTDGLFEAAPVGLMSIAPGGKILAMNQALEKWLGRDLSEASHISDILDIDGSLFNKDAATVGQKIRTDTHLVTSGETHIPIVMQANWIEMGDGNLVAVTSIHGHSNIQTQLRSEDGENATQLMSQAGLSDTDSPMAAIEVDHTDLSKARIVRVNKAFTALMGKEVTSKASLSDVFHVEGGFNINAPIETHFKNEDQTPISLYVTANHALKGGAWIYMVDISTRRSLETQLSQSQKMQAIGQLAAGVAHDFNNLLQAIRLNTDELLGRHPLGDPSYPELQKINSTVTRAAALVSKLLAFSRQQTLRPIVLDVGEALSDIMIVLQQVMVERVKLDIVHGRGVPDILADKSQLETVLMNLCVNARDAMAETSGGTITISTDFMDRTKIDDAAMKQSLLELSSDRLAVISVTDNGSGIPADILEKIFEPFFTTKEQGKGTGLGLATVYGIVQQSGGHLSVESTVGVGTTFRLFFPEVDAEKARLAAEAAAKIPLKDVKRAPADLAGQGNILFVEDEDNVRVIAAKTLRKRGYNVLEACDGEEALELLEEVDTPFDLLISDVVMPVVDGPTLLKRGKEMLGEARIVFISGYAEEDFSDLLAEYPDVSFLPKPFTLTQLAEKVKQEIGEVVV